MQVLHSAADYRGGPPAVTIGNFDGVHLGHQAILDRLGEEAERDGSPRLVLTFDPHPATVVRPDSAPRRLNTLAQRGELLEARGVEALLLHPFDASVAALSPEEFVRRVLADGLRASIVVVGAGFRFGRDRAGRVADLEDLGRRYGFRALDVAPVRLADGTVISSSRIREAVASGWLERAGEMLGRPYFLDGLCVPGASRGRSLGYPTANLKPDNDLLPAEGVYVTECEMEGTRHPAVTNIGHRPTFRGEGISIESHLLGFEGDLRDRPFRLHLHRRLRDERRFDGPDDLVAQIERDVEEARAFFRDV